VTDDLLNLTYQSFGQMEGMEVYQTHLENMVHSAASTSSKVTVLRLESVLVEGKGFASSQALEVPSLLRSIAGAVENGTEAVAIGNGFDPGLWEARELFDVPILGLFETAIFYAIRVGWRVGVLCSGNSGLARIEELAARYGISSRLVRPEAVGVTVPNIVTGFQDSAVADQLLTATDASIEMLRRRGAELVIIASGALDVFFHAHRDRATSAIPVLPGVQILVRETETAAALARLGVPFISRVGRFAQPPASVMRSLNN
jgi:Asp/Glu/hydantoin racemase